ncbi:MAG: Chemotaxis signal transduction protein [Verrucomicrobia bacterium]|nr:MAG: Chemotaxis signal transduction protein [Verrucomicrobiota bacterium]
MTATSRELFEPYIIARVGGERFGFATRDVEEALDAPTVGWVPVAQRGLLGQMRHRDRTVSAFDGGWMFGLARRARSGDTPGNGAATALMLRDGDRRVALIVDDVEELCTIDMQGVRPVPRGADEDGILRGVVFAPAPLEGLLSLVRVAALIDRATSGDAMSE